MLKRNENLKGNIQRTFTIRRARLVGSIKMWSKIKFKTAKALKV
jgi:hypothetical protein